MGERPRFPPKGALLISIMAVSTASILIRMSNAGPLAIAAYRLAFATLILLPFFLRNGGPRSLKSVGKRRMAILIVVGVILALHFTSWTTSLSFTSVASSAIFVHIDPIFVAVISHLFIGERLNRRIIVGILTAFIGAIILFWGDFNAGGLNLYGDALAVMGALMLGIYIMSGRSMRQRLSLLAYVTPVYATSTLVLFLGCILSGTPMLGYSAREYLLFLAIAVVPMIFGHTVYNWALKYVRATIVSISLLGEPVGATILAFIVLEEMPTLTVLVGGAITLIGIYVCISSNS